MPDKKPFPTLQDIVVGKFVKTSHSLFSPEIINMRNAYSSRHLTEMGPIDQIFHQKVTKPFLQAVIDDDRQMVAKMLDANPQLLIIDLPNEFVIESKYTGQKFFAKSALMMACKRKQTEMVKLLLPYYDKLNQSDEVIKAKTEALSAWQVGEMSKNQAGEDVIDLPSVYQDYAEELIEQFRAEQLPLVQLSDHTELYLTELYAELLPDAVIDLDNYLDIELLLVAICKAYYKHYRTLIVEVEKAITEDRAEHFCNRVIGILQRVLPPETAKILCQGLRKVIEADEAIGINAESLLLADGSSYYLDPDDNRRGFGFTNFCNHEGQPASDALKPVIDLTDSGNFAWMKYVVNKELAFRDIQFAPQLSVGLKR